MEIYENQSNRSKRFSAQPLQEEEYAQLIIPSIAHARHNHLHSDEPKIGRLVLVRHGQSEWNVTDPSRNLTARFVSYNAACDFLRPGH